MTTQEQKETTKARWGAAIVVIASVVLLAGFVYHPWIGNPGDPGFLAALAAVGSGLLVLAFLAIRGYLRQAGDERWSVLALPFIVMSSTLYTVLPAMEFAPLAAAEAGNDIQAAQAALLTWFFPFFWRVRRSYCPGHSASLSGLLAAVF